MHFHVITAFPEMITPSLEESILKRALKTNTVRVFIYDLRDHTDDPHRKIDDRPYGGGPGMVLKAEPILRAHRSAQGRKKNVLTVLFTPRGEQYTSDHAHTYAQQYRHIIIICGHYEGVDERVKKILNPVDLSVGPYVLTGGELPALLMIDSVSRHVPGVLGNSESIEENRVASPEVYTRPDVLRTKGTNHPVPEVLRSGNHKEIEEWKRRKSQG